MSDIKKTKRGPKNLNPQELRNFTISCRLNAEEVKRLDNLRNRVTKGEFLRLCFLNLAPQTIPELNQQAYFELSKVAGNLATLATAMRSGEFIQLSEIKTALTEFRVKLIGGGV
jgi:hypothetical protein